MEKIDITFEIDRSKKLYDKYFRFERNREFRKVPVKLLIGLSTIMIIVGVLVKVDTLWILGLISATLTAIILLWLFIQYKIAFNKFWKALEKKSKSSDMNFQFSFDSESIVYKSENYTYELKWALIKNYVINDRDIYLYFENRELFDIISESILGNEMFEKFKTQINEKSKEMQN